MKTDEKAVRSRREASSRSAAGKKRRKNSPHRQHTPATRTAPAPMLQPERGSLKHSSHAGKRTRRATAQRRDKVGHRAETTGTGSRRQQRPAPRRELRPEVVYTPPRQFNRRRFVLQLVTLVAVVLALTLVSSIFFKVKTIRVAGAETYDPWTIREASGIKQGEGLLTFSQARAAGKIKAALPYVKEVRVGIKLPDTVNIEIVETKVVYAVEAVDGSWWQLTAEGKILEKIDASVAATLTRIIGIQLSTPVEEQISIYEESMQNAFGETISASVTAQERIDTLKQILDNLEKNGVYGKSSGVTTVDMSNPTDLQLWYGEKYQVKLGDSSRLAYKITSMQTVFLQEAYLEAGTLDVSFTDEERPNDAIFIPFSQ